MKRFAFLILALAAGIAAQAQIYQYKDESGKTVISDRPPPSNVRSSRVVGGEAAAPAASASPATKSLADRELEFNKRQKERADRTAKDEKDAAQAEQRKEDCARAQRQLQSLESGERIAGRDDNGERYFLDDNQRSQEVARTRKFIADTCK